MAEDLSKLFREIKAQKNDEFLETISDAAKACTKALYDLDKAIYMKENYNAC